VVSGERFPRWLQIIYRTHFMPEGKIKRLTDKGFGFIKRGNKKDLFFHFNSLKGVRYEELSEGQKVSFTEGQGPQGPCAENVTPIQVPRRAHGTPKGRG
jgi:CspA family cold shock protein